MNDIFKNQLGIQTNKLGKRYGSLWALHDCSVMVPRGSLTSLIGPNGAGKSTLLKLLAGFIAPSTGELSVKGMIPQQTSQFLGHIGYLAQEIPLYEALSIEDHIKLGRNMNSRWDVAGMRKRLMDLGLPFNQPVGKLSGGQRAQVGLALAMAKRPDILLLDEPVAALDPLARHDFLASLAHSVAETGTTVIMSSHLLSDLEYISDRMIILAKGKTQLCDSVDNILANHKVLVGKRVNHYTTEDDFVIVNETHTERQTTLLVHITKPIASTRWEVREPSLEDIVLAYMGQDERTSVTLNKEDR